MSLVRWAWKTQKYGALLMLFVLLGALVFIFILLPIVNMIVQESPQTLGGALTDPEVLGAIFMSLYTATIATAIAFTFGMPLAYVLARLNFPAKGLVDTIIDIPILIPHTVAGVALLTLFGPYGLIGRETAPYGIRFTDTVLGIVIAQLFVSSPFLIKTAREAFESVNPNLENVARTLGASTTSAFFKVTFPLAFRGILTGCILTWARAISEFGAVIILAYYPFTAPSLIYRRFVGWGLSNARPIAVLLILVTFFAFICLKLLQSKPFERVIRVMRGSST